MRIHILIVIILVGITLFGPSITRAEECVLAVSVEDFFSKQSVEGAVVQIKRATNNAMGLAKETQGKYLHAGVAPGLYFLTVEKEGYKSSTKRIVVECHNSKDSKVFDTSIYLLAGSQQEKVHVIDKDLSRVISAKVGMNDLAFKLPKPGFPIAGRGKSSTVSVRVLINEDGSVKSAKAVSGNPVFWEAAEGAAMKARFVPSVLNGISTKVNAEVTYNFVP